MGTDGDVAYDARSADVAYNSTNNIFLVVWEGDDDAVMAMVENELEIYGQLINGATGEEIGADFRISTMGIDGDPDRDGEDPAVAYDSTNNEFLVVWSGDYSEGEDEIYARRINAQTGELLGILNKVSEVGMNLDPDHDAVKPDVVYNPTENEFLIVWSADEVDNRNEIYGQRLVGGTLVPKGINDFAISSVTAVDVAYDAFNPAVTYNSATNEYLVVWSSDADVFGEEEIFGQMLDEQGLEVRDNDFRISTMGPANDSSYDAAFPDVTYNPTSNEFLVVWDGDDDTGNLVNNELEIFGQRLTFKGVEIGPDDFRISDAGPDQNISHEAYNARVAYDTTHNNYYVVWWGDDNGINSENEVFGQLLDNAGSEIGRNDFRLSDMGPEGNTSYSAAFPALAFNSTSSTVLVVWEGDDNTAPLVVGELEIFSQLVGIPEIDIDGKGVGISDGDVTPSIIDDTDFGAVALDGGRIDKTFAISNTDGTGTLNLTGMPRVKIFGDHAADFTVVTFPGATVTPGLGTIAVVRFDPSALGLRTATISIDSDDLDESNYDFSIQGTGANPEIAVSGNGNDITDGDVAPLESNHTHFGAILADEGSVLRTFTIENTGGVLLNLNAVTPIEIIDADAAEFTVTGIPLTSIGSGVSTSFTITYDPSSVTTSKATVSIENDDPDEDPFTFSIVGIGAADTDTDNDGEYDFLDEDDDNDGVSDIDEENDGTNPLDAGSVIERFDREVCVEWNGFISFLSQIFELRNTSDQAITLDVALYNIAGTTQSRLPLALEPGIQQDVILNDLVGFETNTYGLACAEITSGPAEALGGQLVTYRFTASSYSLAFKSEFLPARTGEQFFTYNTFQPSLNPADQTNFVANWVQLINDEDTTQSGRLWYYDSEGNVLSNVAVQIGPKDRRDIPIHTLGSFLTGLVAWVPDSANAKFRMRQNRYYYGPTGIEDLVGAVSLPAKRGTGEVLLTPFDTENRTVALEISNTSSSDVPYTAFIFDENGNAAATQPPDFQIPAKGTRGLVINEYLASSRGNVLMSTGESGSLMVNIVEYGRAEDGSLLYASPNSAREALGSTLRGSYNSFREQSCRLRVASRSGDAEIAKVSMTRYDGTVLLDRVSITIPAAGEKELDLCSNETEQAYGEVLLEATNPKVLVAEVIRENGEGVVEFGGALNP